MPQVSLQQSLVELARWLQEPSQELPRLERADIPSQYIRAGCGLSFCISGSSSDAHANGPGTTL